MQLILNHRKESLRVWGHGSADRGAVWHSRSPGFSLQHCMKPGAEAHTCNPENQKSRVTLSSILSSKPAPSLRSLLSEQQQQTHKEPWELTMLFLQLLWVLNYFRKKRYFRVLVLIHCRLESPENLVAKWSCHWALPQKNMTKSAGNPKCSPQRCPILSPSVAQWLGSLQSSDRFTGEPEFWLHYFRRKCFSIPENQFIRVSLQPDFFSAGLCLCACFQSWELSSPRGHLTYGAGETRAAGREFLLLELVFT